MKRILLSILLLCFVLAGCETDVEVITPSTPEPTFTVAPTETQKPSSAKDKRARTIDISKGISEDKQSFSYKFDFDLNQVKEEITINAFIPDSLYEGELQVSIGDYSTKLEFIEGTIDAVYACDIDKDDGAYDIAIITCEGSGDPRIRILKYNSSLSAYEFKYSYDGGITDDMWFGYAISYYLNVNDDNTITIEAQTPSQGMWSVMKTYRLDEHFGFFEEVKPKQYKILPDFMEGRSQHLDMTSEEKDMWEKGYIKAYIDYDGNNFTIEKGEYIKPLYDDGNDHILVEKENGEQGWMTLSYDLYSFNQHYFYLAG